MTDIAIAVARGIQAPIPRIDAPPRGAPGQLLEGRFMARGGLRGYRLYVPAGVVAGAADTAQGPRRALPLVVMLHGCAQTPEDFAAGTRMNDAAREQGFLVLWPAQCGVANAMRCWNWYQAPDQRRDAGEAGLLAGLVRHVMDTHPVDPARVYVAGLSAGGAMAAVMGAAYPDLFAAVGVHSGVGPGAAQDFAGAMVVMRDGPAMASDAAPLPAPALPPLIVFHGDADDVVHPANGAHLAEGAGGGGCCARCAAGRERQGRRYTRARHHDRAGRVVAEHWSIHGAGHAWSGGSAQGSFTDPSGPSATDAMLRFFFAHTLHCDA